jgi:D-aspartate ligase
MQPGPARRGIAAGRVRRQTRSDATASRPGAIVVGLDTEVGLRACRILARRGVRVVGLAADRRHPACWTRACSRVVIAPTSGDSLLAMLEVLAESEAGAVLLPCTDASVHTLAHAAERLEMFRVVLPTAEVVDTLSDERRFAELARAHALPFASTRILAERPLESHLEPVVRASSARGAGQRYSCSCYVSPHGIPILTFVAQTLRRWPPPSGPSRLAVAVRDEHVRDLALDVLSSVPFIGMATIDTTRDVASGSLRVVGVTVGRPTSRTGIAEAGGVGVLYRLYCDAIGVPLPVDRPRQRRRASAEPDAADPAPFVAELLRRLRTVTRRDTATAPPGPPAAPVARAPGSEPSEEQGSP